MAATWIEHELQTTYYSDVRSFDVWSPRVGVRSLAITAGIGSTRSFISAKATPNGWRQIAADVSVELESLLELEAMIVDRTGKAQQIVNDQVYEQFNWAVCVATGEEDFDEDYLADKTALSPDKKVVLLRFGRTVIFCTVGQHIEATTHLSVTDAESSFTKRINPIEGIREVSPLQ